VDQHLRQQVQRSAAELAKRLAVAQRRADQGEAPEKLSQEVAVALDEAMDHLARTGCWGPANRMASNELWKLNQQWLRHGDLQVHARFKPRGYAGDYQLLQKICDGSCCPHPLGHAMDAYFQSQAAPVAVRERTELVAEQILQRCWSGGSPHRAIRIVSVGSGPAEELQRVAQRLAPQQAPRLHLTLLDLDQQALEYVAQRFETFRPWTHLQTVRTNLSRLDNDARLPDLISEADYVFCTGFLDYLDDAAATELLLLLYRWLAPGGQMTVFNFSPGNASRAYMEWIGNWYLTYRDESAMQRLADSLPADARWESAHLSHDTLTSLTVHRISS
jgi:hypothetical protein